MSDEVLTEEFEVLESIYPDELTKVSDRELSIIVEPEESVSGLSEFKLVLHVSYPPEYPDVYPDVTLTPEDEDDEGGDNDLTTEERTQLLQSLQEIGNENIGTAMTFTLVSHLRERLFEVLQERAAKILREEREKERKALEEEEARTRGTPVTTESFLKWRMGFTAEQAAKKKKEDDEKMKGWTPKEKEEARRFAGRLSGRQLFERGGQAAALEDASLFEEGDESVDISMFDRTEREMERDEEEVKGVHLSDSD